MAGQGTGIGIFDDDTTAKDAAKYFALDRVEGTTAYYICDFRFDGSDAAAWRQNTMWSIATELGLTGTLHASCLEGEKAYQLTLYGTVKTPPVVTVSAVILTPERINLSAAGQTYILSTEIVPANATNKTVSYKSSNKSVATVSSTGVVRAVGEGTATITVTAADGSKTDTCIVTVSLAHVHDAKLKEVPAATATCTKKGNKAYYICEGCGAWFSDAGAKNEIKDKDSVTIPVQEHTPSAWKYDKDKHWKVCTASGCGVTIDGSSGRHKDADKNGKCDTCGYTLNSKVPNETIRDESDSTDPKADMTEDPTGTNPNKPQRQEGEKDVTDFSITTDTLIIIGGIAVGVILLCIILIVISKRKR